MGEANWYLPDESRDQLWREKVPYDFRIKPSKTLRRGLMTLTSLMKVPSTKGGCLFKALVKQEPQITKVFGYTVK